MKLLKLLGQKLSAAVIGGFMAGVASVGDANAQGLDELVTDTADSLVNIPQLITAVTYIGGAILAAQGIIALKHHVDSPTQKGIREGLVRLVAGALLLAAPVAFSRLTETLGVNTGTEIQNQNFDQISL